MQRVPVAKAKTYATSVSVCPSTTWRRQGEAQETWGDENAGSLGLGR